MAFVSPIFHRQNTRHPFSSSTFCEQRQRYSAHQSNQPRLPKSQNATRMCDKAEEEIVSLKELKARLAQSQTNDGKVQASEAYSELQEENTEVEEDTRSEKQKEIDRLRAAEKFIEVDEGKYECTGCEYLYDPSNGDRKNSIPAGTPFEDLPGSYTCPQCRTPKRRFISRKKVIAGFADNQKYGFGSNTLTGGEKSLLIFGGLGLCALLLLSGYAMN